jgi:hypothetical protein
MPISILRLGEELCQGEYFGFRLIMRLTDFGDSYFITWRRNAIFLFVSVYGKVLHSQNLWIFSLCNYCFSESLPAWGTSLGG